MTDNDRDRCVHGRHWMFECVPCEQAEADGPRLWDAGDVCCAAFQLGACAHTESGFEEDYDEVVWDHSVETLLGRRLDPPDFDTEPF